MFNQEVLEKFKSEVSENSYGKSLIATEDLPEGTIVEIFEGVIVSYNDVPEKEKCYAIFVGEINEDKWMLYKTNARYANHSCDPNCFVGDDLKIITIKDVKKGEELTYSYNGCYDGEDPKELFWDPAWNFECKCGSEKCQKIIDRYRLITSSE